MENENINNEELNEFLDRAMEKKNKWKFGMFLVSYGK